MIYGSEADDSTPELQMPQAIVQGTHYLMKARTMCGLLFLYLF